MKSNGLRTTLLLGGMSGLLLSSGNCLAARTDSCMGFGARCRS